MDTAVEWLAAKLIERYVVTDELDEWIKSAMTMEAEQIRMAYDDAIGVYDEETSMRYYQKTYGR